MIAFLTAGIALQAARNEDDIRLLLRVQRRDQTALSELYDRYSSLVYTIVLRVVKATDEAEDLVQEVFMQIWNKAASFSQDKGSVYTWIVTIAKRKAIDRLRSKDIIHKGESLSEEEQYIEIPDAAYMTNPLHAAMSAEYERIIRKGLDELSVEQRTAIELSYFDGYTQEQIAQRLNIPLGTVKTRQRQGLIKLRDILKSRVN
jgi:RNA polymerase sigma-70 factor (ECF subfamily)